MIQDMTTEKPGKALFRFAIPMAIGNLLQQLYNIADTVIIGRYVGSQSLAAVGNATNINFLLVAIATGFGIGASVIISQYFGAKRMEKVMTTISTGVILAFALSVLLTLIGILGCKGFLRMIKTPEDIFPLSYEYLKIYFIGLIGLFLFNICSAVFQALGDSKTPFWILLCTTVINVGLDLLLICRYHQGVAGAAWATITAQFISVILAVSILYRRLKKIQIKEKYPYYQKEEAVNIFKVAVPSILQQSVISLGILALQALVNSYGTTAVAGYTAAAKIDGVAMSPMAAIGNAVSTFAAQNMGAKKYDRIKQGIHWAILLDAILALIVILIVFLQGENLVRFFLEDGEQTEVINIAMDYLTVVSLGTIIMGVMQAYTGALRGIGDMKVFLLSFTVNMSSRVIFAYLLSYLVGWDGIWFSLPMSWSLGLVIGYVRFRSGKWKYKKTIDKTEKE